MTRRKPPNRPRSRPSFAAPAGAALTCASCSPCSRPSVRQCIRFGFEPLPFRTPSAHPKDDH